jgi:hypothetical protein
MGTFIYTYTFPYTQTFPGGVITMTNTIVAGNMGGSSLDCFRESGSINSSGYNLIGSTSGCTFAASSGDKLNINPDLGPLSDNGGPTLTHALLTGSPAIDAGNNASCPATDQRGTTRPQGGRCDIGAFEFEEPTWFVFLPMVRK